MKHTKELVKAAKKALVLLDNIGRDYITFDNDDKEIIDALAEAIYKAEGKEKKR